VQALQQALLEQLRDLALADPAEVDTTLLIHPLVLQDFEDFNQFLGFAEGMVEALGLEGVLQVASFHPQFQFADTEAEEVTNATNRSPYPTLHLLREKSIDRAVEAFPEVESIYEANIETMRRLGTQDWYALRRRWAPHAPPEVSGATPDPRH
jgi:hypothetical protein